MSKCLRLTRRKFLIMGWAGLMGFLVATIISTVKFLFPNVLFETPTVFKMGKPSDYPKGSVTFLEEQKVYFFHTERGYHVISAVCTHLGCTVSWNRQNGKFVCPCHGSEFDKNGKVTKAPAAKPLAWFDLKVGADGRFIVDLGKVVKPGSSSLSV